MTHKHTPGPWSTLGDELYGGDGSRVAEAVKSTDKGLLRAAPDLLKALQLITGVEDSALALNYVRGLACAAIAKVTS